MKFLYFSILIIVLFEFPPSFFAVSNGNKNVVLDDVVDIKDFKKLLRTKTNVLVCFTSSLKQSIQTIKVFRETAIAIKGQATMVLIDCSGEAKKLCKKLKVYPEPYILKHYKDGEFHKDYDRKESVNSMVNFMRDPTGDLPWEEDSTANNVVHVVDAVSLGKLIKKEHKPIMIMFYAPWCGFCKTLKPEYAEAANELQGHSVLAAIDVTRPENAVIRAQYNISEFPTLLYYSNGAMKFHYSGETDKHGLVAFMKNPQAAPVKVKEPEWSDTDSEIVHLTTTSFDPVIKEESSLLVMFYSPWCGHCKRMKPEYEKAAATMKLQGIPGMLAAVDATKEQAIASRYAIKGYPTVKYFTFGEFKFDVNVRESTKIVEFMENPQEPPPAPPVEVSWSDQKSNVVHLTEETYKPFLKRKKHVLVMFYAPWCGHCKKAKPEFTKAADALQDDPRIAFVAVDCTTEQSICKSNHIQGYPTFRYFSYSKSVKAYNGGRTAQDFISFMSETESPPPASLPPADNWATSGASSIVLLRDDNFKQDISSTDTVMVMFFAPWCGHCKTMKPDYEKAANELKSEGFNGHLAMFNSIDNPIITEEYEIAGFPTMKLFVKGKHVADYKGPRTAADIKDFVKNYSKQKVEL